MKKLYLVTGATGHLGNQLTKELLKRNEKVRVFILPEDERFVPDNVEYVKGSITNKEDLEEFFQVDGYDTVTLIHAAARITIATKEDPLVWDVNVNGTKNVMELAYQNHIDRVIYVSSVHAIPEKPKPEVMTEVDSFSKDLVHGQYAKSKAEAAQIVVDYAKKGLNVSIVHPSGIIGPGDIFNRNSSVQVIRAIYKGRITIPTEGGYDFVDVRDVVDGILNCEEKGKSGECYLLSGNYIEIKEIYKIVSKYRNKKHTNFTLPLFMVKPMIPISEWINHIFKNDKPIFTQYSIYTLDTNAHFSNEKAKRELGFTTRNSEESIRDSIEIEYVKYSNKISK